MADEFIPTSADAKKFYEELNELYPDSDHWHRATHKWIARFVRGEFRDTAAMGESSVLNVGSGGQSFGLPESSIVHLDLHSNGFRQGQHLIVADIQTVPALGRSFDNCICVGSVINHCDAAAALATISRELRSGGRLILEFESSYSLEFLGTRAFRKSASVVRTAYQELSISLWAYAPDHIRSLLEAMGMRVVKSSVKHIISPLVYRIIPHVNIAAAFHRVDCVAARIPLLRRCAHNVIFVCRKL